MGARQAGARLGPSLLNRVAAGVRGEQPTVDLEAFERAGAAAFELDLVVDERRRELSVQGVHPWEADSATASLFLSVWNARVLQTLGAELLAADRSLDPRTRGYLPPATHRQAWAYFQPVASWLAAARRAAASPDYWVGDDVDLPAALPALVRSGGAPAKHLKCLLMAADAVDRLLEQTLSAVLSAGPPPPAYEAHHHRVRELAAQARSALHYAQALWHPEAEGDLRDIVLRHLQPALVLEHHLGQFLALPELLDSYRQDGPLPRRRPGRARRRG
jgi:hypothetical protein